MQKAKIVTAPKPERGVYTATTQHTGLSQRDSLEEVMINLASVLGIKEIHKALTARYSYIYEPQGRAVGHHFLYQSATNTILELSKKVLEHEKTVKR